MLRGGKNFRGLRLVNGGTPPNFQPMRGSANLETLRVLVVEDDYFIAHRLAEELERLGVEVVGPFGDVDDAVEVVNDADAAILDVRIRNETSYPVADCLRGRQIPFLFYTGLQANSVPGRFASVPVYRKPAAGEMLLDHLRRARTSAADPGDPVTALPRLRMEARRALGDAAAADRLVEVTLMAAISWTGQVPRDQDRLEEWLVSLLYCELHRRGRRLMN